jgi:tripartite ATP-independent transporter DctM subunit
MYSLASGGVSIAVLFIAGYVPGLLLGMALMIVALIYTLVLGFAYKEISITDISPILIETVKTSSIVLLLIATFIAMSWVMSYENIPQEISNTLLSISDYPIVILIIINLILLFVGIFMDMTPAVLIFTPIFLRIVTELGMDPIHFGIIMNLCIGLCTPTVGSVLFLGCSVANLKIKQVIKPLLPLFLAMISILLLITYFPELTLWLPRQFDLI